MCALASVYHGSVNIAAEIVGLSLTEGMIVIPCSMRTLGSIASGYGEHLIHRAADVVLKERRRLVLVVRELRLSELHLEKHAEVGPRGRNYHSADAGFFTTTLNRSTISSTIS